MISKLPASVLKTLPPRTVTCNGGEPRDKGCRYHRSDDRCVPILARMSAIKWRQRFVPAIFGLNAVQPCCRPQSNHPYYTPVPQTNLEAPLSFCRHLPPHARSERHAMGLSSRRTLSSLVSEWASTWISSRQARVFSATERRKDCQLSV